MNVMKKIILDTNMLLVPVQFNVDIFDEIDRLIEGKYQIVTLDLVVNELKKMAKSNSKDAKAAKVGLELIKNKKVKIVKSKIRNTDNAIIQLANNNIVATNDKLLRQKLRNKNIKTIYLRNKKFLEMD